MTTSKRSFVLPGLLGCIFLATNVTPTRAEDGPNAFSLHEAKYFATIGLFVPNRDLRLGLDASFDVTIPEADPYIDFSEQFDIESVDETFSAEIGWNFGKRWQFRGQYFRVEGAQRAALGEDVQWGDYIFGEGTSIAAGLDIQITRLFFGRKFWGSERYEAGLGIGGHIIDLGAFINGDAIVDGQDVGFVQERASASQPLPNIGGWFRRLYADRWILQGRLDWLAADIDKYNGHIINASLSMAYTVNNRFAVSLAYNLFEIDVRIDDTNWDGQVRSRFHGPYIALSTYW